MHIIFRPHDYFREFFLPRNTYSVVNLSKRQKSQEKYNWKERVTKDANAVQAEPFPPMYRIFFEIRRSKFKPNPIDNLG